jgi:hypothetical protein
VQNSSEFVFARESIDCISLVLSRRSSHLWLLIECDRQAKCSLGGYFIVLGEYCMLVSVISLVHFRVGVVWISRRALGSV